MNGYILIHIDIREGQPSAVDGDGVSSGGDANKMAGDGGAQVRGRGVGNVQKVEQREGFRDYMQTHCESLVLGNMMQGVGEQGRIGGSQ